MEYKPYPKMLYPLDGSDPFIVDSKDAHDQIDPKTYDTLPPAARAKLDQLKPVEKKEEPVIVESVAPFDDFLSTVEKAESKSALKELLTENLIGLVDWRKSLANIKKDLLETF